MSDRKNPEVLRIAEKIRESPNQSWLLTGGIDSGKSMCLKALVAELKCGSSALYAGGLISEGIRIHGSKAAYKGINIITGAEFPFAVRQDIDRNEIRSVWAEYPDDWEADESDVMMGKWRIFSHGLKKAADALADAVRMKCKLAVVDEYGPLEIAGGGFRKAVDAMHAANQPFLLVVREQLVGQVMALYPMASAIRIVP